MHLKATTPPVVCQAQGLPCPVCTRLASNLPPSLLELVDVLAAKEAGRREIISIAVFLGWMAGREGQI